MQGWSDANAEKIRTSACYSSSKFSPWSSLESGEKRTTKMQKADREKKRRRKSKQTDGNDRKEEQIQNDRREKQLTGIKTEPKSKPALAEGPAH